MDSNPVTRTSDITPRSSLTFRQDKNIQSQCLAKILHFTNSEWNNAVLPIFLLEDPMKRYYDNAKEILPTTKPDSDLSTVPEEDEEDETDNIAAKLQGKSKILLSICCSIF